MPEEKVDERVWCSNACYQGSLNLQNNAVNELTKFMNTVGEKYYDIQYNTDLMTGWLRDHNRTMTEDALLDAFFSLDKQGKLLKRLSAKEINSLTSEQYAQRLHIDPEMTNDSTTLSAVRKYQQKSGGVN